MRLAFTLLGQAASKANRRELAVVGVKGGGKRSILRKSDSALDFETRALRQIPTACRVRLEGPVCVTMRLLYASERPDLDETLVLDILQDRWKRMPKKPDGSLGERVLVQAGVYRNDRQVREKHVYHGVDRKNPRVEVVVEPLYAQQASILETAACAS